MHDLRVEFTPNANLPDNLGSTGREQQRLARPRSVIVAVALLTAAAFISVRGHDAETISGRPLAVPTTDPTPTIRAAFADHLPGSVVLVEDTLAGHGSVQTLRLRALRAVYGNVVIIVTIQLASAAAPETADVRIVHLGYQIDFTFVGYYPPTTSELKALADDSRLISLQA